MEGARNFAVGEGAVAVVDLNVVIAKGSVGVGEGFAAKTVGANVAA